MVQVHNGKVVRLNDEKRIFFGDFLKSNPVKTIDIKYEPHNDRIVRMLSPTYLFMLVELF